MYADGTIVSIKNFKGVQLTKTQIDDYVAGKTIQVDGCQGNYPTMYIKFDPDRMIPGFYGGVLASNRLTSLTVATNFLLIYMVISEFICNFAFNIKVL